MQGLPNYAYSTPWVPLPFHEFPTISVPILSAMTYAAADINSAKVQQNLNVLIVAYKRY